MRRDPRPDTLPPPVLSRLLWQWLALGAMALLLLPATRGDGAWPFWLLVAPATGLAVLHRGVFAAAWRAHLVRATPRRRGFS